MSTIQAAAACFLTMNRKNEPSLKLLKPKANVMGENEAVNWGLRTPVRHSNYVHPYREDNQGLHIFSRPSVIQLTYNAYAYLRVSLYQVCSFFCIAIFRYTTRVWLAHL